jgi:uncharacterized protein (DUF302 family)
MVMNLFFRVAMVMLALSISLFAGEYIVKKSAYSVDRTVERFKAIIEKKGFTLFSVIDHQANAKSVDLEMNASKVVIFGNPKGGTVLMNSDIRISLELPLKVAVYQDEGGVKLIYKDPKSYEKQFSVKGSKVIKKVTFGLDKLTDAAVR